MLNAELLAVYMSQISASMTDAYVHPTRELINHQEKVVHYNSDEDPDEPMPASVLMMPVIIVVLIVWAIIDRGI